MSLDLDAQLAKVLVERSPNGVLVTDAAGRVRLCNPALSRMVPVVPNPIGRRPIEAVPVEAIGAALDGDEESEFPLRIGNKDLLVRVVQLGERRGTLAIVQDVSRLGAAERYRQEFVANVSHELRTPATAIAGYAETLLADEGALEPTVSHMVRVILRNARRLTELFEDLLTLARLDASQEPLPLEPIRVRSIVSECVDKLAPLAEQRRIRVVVKVDELLCAQANREALLHVVTNLLSNAIKYSHEGATVRVQGTLRPDGVQLEVEDQGIGIAPLHHDRIFQRFYRVDKGRARKAGGTGLGLAIVKHFVRRMHGRISLRSSPGVGSTFRLMLVEAQPG
jgi:two-component system phosphate regulon sensor histidine kinase PhoR